jgi:chemotaxis family two-component system sensor kinase Cph1
MQLDLDELLKTCEREQLHLSGAIQPHGVLLHVSKHRSISHVSANCAETLGGAPDEVLGRPLSQFLPRVADALAGVAGEGARLAIYGERLPVDDTRTCDIAVAAGRDGWLVEMYPSDARPHARLQAFPHFYQRRKDGIEALCEEAVAAVMRETGFDKVMAYRFREDWAGEVVAEVSNDPSLDAYLGQRFPASDIPKIARDLYVRNPSRSIADVRAPTVPIVARDGDILDLTYSELRSVSPVHLRYLENMRVGASCSFAIVIRGELWGLIACHHATPRTVSLWSRNRSVECVKELAFALVAYETDRKIRFIDRIDSDIESLLGRLRAAPSLAEAIPRNSAAVLDLVGATGAALVAGETFVAIGEAPREDEVRNISEMNVTTGLFATDHLSGVFPGYSALNSVASGALVVHAHARGPSDAAPRFAWFRPEERRTIVWAGDPAKALETANGEARIAPRRSFARWTESMEGHSRPWSSQDLIAAQKFRSAILRWSARD